MWQTHKSGKNEHEDRARIALSSGKAAQYCLVSPGTIVNWITGGMLEAQRTVGGQFRIRVDDLRSFMRDHGMRTDQLDGDFGLHPNCWEYWEQRSKDTDYEGYNPNCTDCPVYKSRATRCHEVRPLLPGGIQQAHSCKDCLFFSTVMETENDD